MVEEFRTSGAQLRCEERGCQVAHTCSSSTAGVEAKVGVENGQVVEWENPFDTRGVNPNRLACHSYQSAFRVLNTR